MTDNQMAVRMAEALDKIDALDAERAHFLKDWKLRMAIEVTGLRMLRDSAGQLALDLGEATS